MSLNIIGSKVAIRMLCQFQQQITLSRVCLISRVKEKNDSSFACVHSRMHTHTQKVNFFLAMKEYVDVANHLF